MSTKKILLLTIAIIVAVVCLGFLGLQAFGKKLYDSRSCDWGNIDNIELHTRTNIPDVTDSECRYDDVTHAKKVVFTLNKRTVDMAHYIAEGKFTKADSKEALPLADIAAFEKNTAAFDNVDSLYFKKSDYYSMILDSESGKLWVYLKYD